MLHYNTDLLQKDNGYDFADRGIHTDAHDGQSFAGLFIVTKAKSCHGKDVMDQMDVLRTARSLDSQFGNQHAQDWIHTWKDNMIQSSFSKPMWVPSQIYESGFELIRTLESSRKLSDDVFDSSQTEVRNATLFD